MHFDERLKAYGLANGLAAPAKLGGGTIGTIGAANAWRPAPSPARLPAPALAQSPAPNYARYGASGAAARGPAASGSGSTSLPAAPVLPGARSTGPLTPASARLSGAPKRKSPGSRPYGEGEAYKRVMGIDGTDLLDRARRLGIGEDRGWDVSRVLPGADRGVSKDPVAAWDRARDGRGAGHAAGVGPATPVPVTPPLVPMRLDSAYPKEDPVRPPAAPGHREVPVPGGAQHDGLHNPNHHAAWGSDRGVYLDTAEAAALAGRGNDAVWKELQSLKAEVAALRGRGADAATGAEARDVGGWAAGAKVAGPGSGGSQTTPKGGLHGVGAGRAWGGGKAGGGAGGGATDRAGHGASGYPHSDPWVTPARGVRSAGPMVDGGVELSREAYAQALEARDAGVTYEARPKSDPGGAGKGGARSEVVRQANQKEQELWDLMKVALAGAPKASTSLARAEDVARTLEQARLTQQLRNAKERREALEATAVGEGARVAEDAYVKAHVAELADALSPGDEAKVEEALSKSSRSDTFPVCKNAAVGNDRTLLGRDFVTLRRGMWLTDEVIRGYLHLLQKRDARWREEGRGTPRVHLFHSHFFATLTGMPMGGEYSRSKAKYDYGRVQRWTRERMLKISGQVSPSVLDCDLIIVPVNLPNHWVCACIDLRHQRLGFFDSMGSQRQDVLQHLARWVGDEYKDKKGQVLDASDWEMCMPGVRAPQQNNGSDCGVFTLMFADCLARGISPLEDATGRNAFPECLCQDKMPHFRNKIARDLMREQAS